MVHSLSDLVYSFILALLESWHVLNARRTFCVLDVLVHLRRVVRLAGAVPGAHVDADGQGVREQLLRGLDVDVVARRGRVGVELRVVRGELAAEG